MKTRLAEAPPKALAAPGACPLAPAAVDSSAIGGDSPDHGSGAAGVRVYLRHPSS